MSKNKFSGGIPEEICDYPNLEFLLLFENPLGLTIPACLGALPKLRGLGIQNCELEGTIPVAMMNEVSEIEVLDLSGNALTGRLPTEMGELVKLKQLYLNENELTGPVPIEFSNLVDLKILDLEFNSLTGTLPTKLGSLTVLESLKLQGNNIRGQVPQEFCNLDSLDLTIKAIGCGIDCACCIDAGACDLS